MTFVKGKKELILVEMDQSGPVDGKRKKEEDPLREMTNKRFNKRPS